MILRNQMMESQPNSRKPKRFFFTSKTNGIDTAEHLESMGKHVDEPVDSNQPPEYQQRYYRQQVVGGQPVYQYGPPPPVQGGRTEVVRSGRETAMAREERRGPGGGNPSFFAYGNDDDSDRVFMFNTVEVRNRFVHKVYKLLTIQLLITFGFVFLAIHVDAIRDFLLRNFLLQILVMCSTIILVIAIVCCESVRKTFPCNIIALGILTLLYAYILANVSCYYDTIAVYMATGTTAIVCFLVSVLACQMKWDITKCGCMLYVLLIGLMIYGMICTLMIFFVDPESFKILHLVYSGLGLAIFILYLMFDTQLIMGGRYMELSPEEYILGALKLYIDIFMIFQFLLALFRQ